jgi:hypothetical protein
MHDTEHEGTPLPGVAKLAKYLETHGLKRAEFARMATERGGIEVDRVTIVQLLNGNPKRVSVPVAVAIERATDGEIAVEDWLPSEAA